MIDENELEKRLRRLTLEKLETLRVFIDPSRKFVTSSMLSTATGSRQQSLGGRSSSLVRTKVGEENLIEIIGKINRNTSRLRLNPKVTTPETLGELINKILGE